MTAPLESLPEGRPKDLLLIRKFVQRTKCGKCKIVKRQIFEAAANLGPYEGGGAAALLLDFANNNPDVLLSQSTPAHGGGSVLAPGGPPKGPAFLGKAEDLLLFKN